ncbi:hypothetical protein [Sphingomonas sp. Leaf357]|uniref:hypothetical protein n=1 Tax=Sphingomonas sp. Leaf357 TaxID=1736350 RepID=UPI0012E0DA54|nr:hypothetical protein [Sphingomonas sp. Leaf357]
MLFREAAQPAFVPAVAPMFSNECGSGIEIENVRLAVLPALDHGKVLPRRDQPADRWNARHVADPAQVIERPEVHRRTEAVREFIRFN